MNTSSLHRPQFLPDLLANALEQTPDRGFLQLEDGPLLTVGEVRDATSQFVQALQSLGVMSGSRVATLSSNRPEVLYVSNAVQLIAAIAVPMHPLAALGDHLHVLQDAKVDVLVFEASRFGELAAKLAEQTPDTKLVALGDSPLAEDLLVLAARFAPAPLIAAEVQDSDIARLGYSGGTTGRPKALATNQRSALACTNIMLAEWEWPTPLRVLSCAPLSHAGSAMLLPSLLKQGTVLIHPGFDPLRVLQTIQEHRITCMLVVPTMIYALLDHPRFSEFDVSSLQTVFYGASAITPARLKEAIEKIGPVFFQFYGQAEAPMTLTVLRKGEHDVRDLHRLGSCGRPVPWIRLELLDADGQRVCDGEPGEICVQGPLVMDGYRDGADLTAEAIRGGWLHTGDVAVRDAQGFLTIVDRTKDMIVSGGFNIYPRQIEDVLAEHDSVGQAAVIGVPHPKWGEAVVALIVLRPGHEPNSRALITLVAERMGNYQSPKHVLFIDSIPQTPLGKPDKKRLREQYRMLVSDAPVLAHGGTVGMSLARQRNLDSKASAGRVEGARSMVSGVWLRVLADVVRRCGVTEEALLSGETKAFMTREPVEVRVALSDFRVLLERAVALTGEPAIGLHCGLYANASAYDMFGPLVGHVRSLREALCELRQFQTLIFDLASLHVTQHAGVARLRWEFPRAYDETDRGIAEFLLACMLRLLKGFGCTRVKVRGVHFEHPRPVHHAAYSLVFEGLEQFCADFTGIEFDADMLDRPHLHANPALQSWVHVQAEGLLARMEQPCSFVERLHVYLLNKASKRAPDMDTAARSLGLSVRSLRRRLSERGISYRALTQATLLERACLMLRNPNCTVQEVAGAMGYADPTAFHRAFKRMTGRTACEYRMASGYGIPGSQSGAVLSSSNSILVPPGSSTKPHLTSA